jgi:hypothetical protein
MSIEDLGLKRFAHAHALLTDAIEKGGISGEQFSKEIDGIGGSLIVNGLAQMLAMAQAGSRDRKNVSVMVTHWICDWLTTQCRALLPDEIKPGAWGFVEAIVCIEDRAGVRYLEEEAIEYLAAMKMLAKAAKAKKGSMS